MTITLCAASECLLLLIISLSTQSGNFLIYPHSMEVGYQCSLHPEDGGSKILPTVDILP